MILPMLYGLWEIFGTASRGAVIALGVCFLFVLFRGAPRQRMVALVIGGIMVFSVPLLLNGSAAGRLGTLFGGNDQEALESREGRSYLLTQSLIYTVRHPVFGIGMSQFPNYEGKQSVDAGLTGSWHETHNAFTQVSSECGVPAVIFFILGLGSAIVSVNRVYKRARREGHTEIANVCFCYLLSMVGYLTSIIFLSNAYDYYLPAMIGLAVALTATAEQEMSRVGPARIAVPNLWNPPLVTRPCVARS
jgi:O-antigen ligase